VLSSRFRGIGRCSAACAAVAAGALALASPALAREVYVANSGSGSVSAFDSSTNAAIATIPVGTKPVDVAISPDGARAYVADEGADAVAVIDTATNTVVGAPIPLAAGSKPDGVAVTPNGQLVYVADSGDDTVSVIGTATNAVLGAPIALPSGSEPDGIAVSPDGTRVFVAQRGKDVSIVDTATNSVVGSVLDSLAPSRIAIGPRGGRAFVTNGGSSSVTAFNPANGQAVGAPIPVGANPAGIAIEPSGGFAYVASPGDGTLTAVDTSLDAAVGTLGGFPGATGIAFSPDGASGYASDFGGSAVTVLNRTSGGVAGTVGVGSEPEGVAVVPDQPPTASFLVTPARRIVKRKLTFHGGASRDPDGGTVATYAWDFGDGKHMKGSNATVRHRYRRPGTYTVTLTVTDGEGCSTELVFTGQTASCNGSAAAVATETIVVADNRGPVLRLAGGHRQRVRGWLKVVAQCPQEACRVRASGVVAVTTRRRRGGSVSARRWLGRAKASPAAGAWVRLRLRVRRGVRRAVLRALRSGGGANAQLKVVAVGESGIATTRTRYVRLVGPHRRRARHRRGHR
jgi:YVTN family beta-propeller protein